MCPISTTMAMKLEKMASKLFAEEVKHIGRGLRGHTSCLRQGTQVILAREYVSSQATLTREYISTQDTLVHEHVSTQGTLPLEHMSTQDMLPH